MAESAHERLIAALREHALVIGEVTLTSGRTASYLIDAKRASILLPEGFFALGELVAAEAKRVGATAVGGTTMGADPVACAALAAGAPVKAFFVRKERKEHGLQRWIEGPPLEPGERCLVVEDVVTTGGSAIHAIERVREEGFDIAGVVSGPRPAGGRRRRDPGRGGRRPLHAAHTDRRRLSGASGPRLGGAARVNPRRARRRSAGARSSREARASGHPRRGPPAPPPRARTSGPPLARHRPVPDRLAPPGR